MIGNTKITTNKIIMSIINFFIGKKTSKVEVIPVKSTIIDYRCIAEINGLPSSFDQFCGDVKEDIDYYNKDKSLKYLGKGKVAILGGSLNTIGHYKPGKSSFQNNSEFHFWRNIN